MQDATSCDQKGELLELAYGDISDQIVDLMNRYEQPLCNFLLVMLADQDLALECAQETFVRAYENLRRGKPVNAQWLYKVARNRAVDELRHRQRVQAKPDVLDYLPWAHETISEEQAAVRRVLEQMLPEDREVLYLHVFDRFKTAEIAHLLGIGAGATRMRLHRARQHFRQLWGERS